jgi:histone deacetylase 1/2
MQMEYDDQVKRNTFIIIICSYDVKSITDKWVYKIKKNSDESISRFKARWVVHGYRQIEGVNYEEKYASVVRSDTSRILLSIAATLDWKIRQLDVKLVFLNEIMNRMIYIVQSKDFEKSKDKACLLNLRLYDLVQSVYLWFQEIKAKMLEYELTQSKHDETLFFDQKRHLYVTVYVNDIKIFSFINEIIDEVSDFLKIKYEMIDLRDVKWYLRMKITRLSQNQGQTDQSDDPILLIQTKYIRDLLIRHEMKECAFVHTSITETKLKKALSRYKCLENQLKQFQILLSELMHLMIQIRFDLTYSVSRLAQFMSNPTDDHWTTLKRMLRYLNETKELSILYKKASGSLILKAWIDFSWDEDPNDSRSTHDHLLFMRDGSIGWKSSKQISVALSSTEAEYMSQTSAVINVMWARRLLTEMKIDDTMSRKNQSTIIYANNQEAIKLVNNSIFQKRTKHIVVKYHYTRDLISQKKIKLKYRLIAQMIADGLIKSLRSVQFKRFVDQLRMAKRGSLDDLISWSIGDSRSRDQTDGSKRRLFRVNKTEFFQSAGLLRLSEGVGDNLSSYYQL